MRKYVPLLTILVILLVIWGAFSFFQVDKARQGKEIFTDIGVLYSKFSPYMKEQVDFNLKNMKCEPNEYYYENSKICFICKNSDICFEYRIEKEAENMKKTGKNITIRLDEIENITYQEKFYLNGLPELKNSDYDVDYADFYFNGFASAFNCEKGIFGGEELHCDYGVKFVFEEADVVIGDVVMVLEDESGWSDVSSKICKKLKGEQGICEQKDVDKKIEIENTEIILSELGVNNLCMCEDVYIYVKNNWIFYGSGITCYGGGTT